MLLILSTYGMKSFWPLSLAVNRALLSLHVHHAGEDLGTEQANPWPEMAQMPRRNSEKEPRINTVT